MKSKEFQKIKSEFNEETKRFKSLKVGSIIYEEVAREGDIDCHKMIIDKINIRKREVVAHDAKGKHKVTLSDFLTQKEFKKQYIQGVL